VHSLSFNALVEARLSKPAPPPIRFDQLSSYSAPNESLLATARSSAASYSLGKTEILEEHSQGKTSGPV